MREALATWEDLEALRHRFPETPPLGTSRFTRGGSRRRILSPFRKIDKEVNYSPPRPINIFLLPWLPRRSTTPAASVSSLGRRLPTAAPPAHQPPTPSSPPFLTRRASPPPPSVTGPPLVRPHPTGGATAPPRLRRRRSSGSPHLPLLGPPDMNDLRILNPEILTLRSAASTTAPAGGDLAAGCSPHLPPCFNLTGGQAKRARPTLILSAGEEGDRVAPVSRTNLKHRKVGGLSTFRKVYRISGSRWSRPQRAHQRPKAQTCG
jgi:hypothetical protein